MYLLEEFGVIPMTLSGVWNTNLIFRPERDWEELKGRAVNYDIEGGEDV